MYDMTAETDREQKNAVFTAPSNTDGGRKQPPVQHVPSTADLGFELAIESVPLPSNGVVYPSTSPLHLRETVDIRPMTSREEDILTSRALVKNGTVISKVVESCITDKRVNVREMLSGDINAVMVAVRITGYGSKYDVRIKCSSCDKQFDHTTDLSQLVIKRMTIQPDEIGQNLFSAVLPKTGAAVKFKFMTAGDDELAIAASEAKKKSRAAENNIVTGQLTSCLVSVNGRTDRPYLLRFVSQLPAEDSRFIRKLISENEPGIDMRDTVVCDNPDCGETEVVPIPIGASFFWPDA